MKLDKVDKKLLSYLYHNYREPLTEIAKVCKVSRDQVEYRVNKYEREGLIKKYLTIFNYNILGYKEIVIVYLKLNGNDREKIREELEEMCEIITYGDVVCEYDIFFDAIYKDRYDFEKKFNTFVGKYKLDYSIMQTTQTLFFPLKCFENNKEEDSYEIVPNATISLTDKDLNLLKIIEENGREKIINIAKKSGLSSELIVYKLKQFHKNKIILGSRIQFDMESQGFYFAVLRLKLNFNSEIFTKIKTFCKNHKHINALSFGISDSYNCIIQIFYEDEKTLRETINQIKNKLDNCYSKSQLLMIEKESKANTLPF